jgi:hypothetical protein
MRFQLGDANVKIKLTQGNVILSHKKGRVCRLNPSIVTSSKSEVQ